MIKGVFYIEAQGNNERLVRDSIKSLAEKIRRDKDIKVEKEDFGEVIEDNGNFSSTLEVELEFSSFQAYVIASINYGPSAIEIYEPENLKLSSKEFLKAVGEVIRICKTFYDKYKVRFEFSGTEVKEVGLTDDEIEELIDQGGIRAKIVVEGTGKNRREAIRRFLASLPEDVAVNKVKSKKVESETPFSGVIGIDAILYSPTTLFDIAVKYTPVLINIIEPSEVKLSILDIQDIGVELAGVFFEIAFNLAKP